MSVKVSVIIPVYNVEKYIKECLDSVSNQVLRDIEIICVEDCSTDHSLNLLNEYRSQDNRIRIIRNKENRGLSYSRNVGIEQSLGNYIFFLDSDDYIPLTALDDLYTLASKNEVEGILFDAQVVYEEEDLKHTSFYHGKRKYSYDGVYLGSRLFTEMVENDDYDPCVTRQFWSRSFLQGNKLKFYEGILHEDNLFTFQAILSSKSLMIVKEEYYYYRKRAFSITTKEYNLSNVKGLFQSIIEMLEFWKLTTSDLELDKRIHKYITDSFSHLKHLYTKANKEQLIYFDNKITGCLYDMMIPCNKTYIFYSTEFMYKIKKIKSFEHVILYGAGMVAKELLSVFQEHEISIIGVAVTDKTKNNQSFMGHKLYSIEELCIDKEKTIIVIGVTSNYREEIQQILDEKEYSNYISML